MEVNVLPIFVFAAVTLSLAIGMLVVGRMLGPKRTSAVKDMPYESGMDPIHDTHKRFDVRFHIVAIAFLVFDVELLFLYPWAVANRAAGGIQGAVAGGLVENRELVFGGFVVFFLLLLVGFIYDWRKGVFRWR